jgi:ribonuclease P protein component
LFQAVAASNAHGHARLGLSIAARSVGDSVERNRIRRLVRETFRLQQHEFPPIDLIVSARAAARGASAGALRADLVLLFATIISRCASSSSRSSRPGAGS